MQKKKILHFITGLGMGGAEKMLLKVVPNIQDDFENRVCCLTGHGSIADELKEKGIKIYYLNFNGIFDIGVIGRFRDVIKEFNPDLLACSLIHANLFGRFFGRLFGVKKITTSIRTKLYVSKYFPLVILDALTSFMVNRYHFNGPSIAKFYNRYLFVPRKKTIIIPNGIELKKFDVSVDIEAKRRSLGMGKSDMILGCVATFKKQKGHRYLMTAMKDVVKENSNIKLLLIGDGAERGNLESQVKENNLERNIIFLGNRDDVPELLKVMDIFVLPTLFEGMSNAVLEAMIAKVPVITTNIPENKELILNTENGILVPTKDPEALCKAILGLVKDSNKQGEYRQVAYEESVKKYNIESVIKRFKRFYREV